MSINILNRKYPISLKYIQHLVDRVYSRYPLIEKYEITLIIKYFFESIRDILLNDDIITIAGLFSSMRIIKFNRIRKDKFHYMIKVKLTTSQKLK